MFMGEYQHSLDANGRIIVPSKFREELGTCFFATKGSADGSAGNYRCIVVYTSEDWARINEKLKNASTVDMNVTKLARFLFSGASECVPDKNGRIMISQALREYAEIQKDVVTIGVSSRIEIWSKENWDKYNREENFIDSTIAEKVSMLGI
ncbi:MAG: division/cell wall cluster transcriptional repressor MraZ [Firmicutes bacterium]|nr:division/cell wall cluster transcriptional repressor MraZ [Bacillota bacterium]